MSGLIEKCDVIIQRIELKIEKLQAFRKLLEDPDIYALIAPTSEEPQFESRYDFDDPELSDW